MWHNQDLPGIFAHGWREHRTGRSRDGPRSRARALALHPVLSEGNLVASAFIAFEGKAGDRILAQKTLEAATFFTRHLSRSSDVAFAS